MAADGDVSPGAENPGILSTEELMIGVRERARRASRTSAHELGVIDLLSQARDPLDAEDLLASRLLGDRSEWDLQTRLRIESHRPVLGRLLVALKRHLLLPPLRWLYEYSQGNFARQRTINRTLFAYLEILARENVRLRAELKGRGGGAVAEGRPETPAP